MRLLAFFHLIYRTCFGTRALVFSVPCTVARVSSQLRQGRGARQQPACRCKVIRRGRKPKDPFGD
jgi:hypothetical protein